MSRIYITQLNIYPIKSTAGITLSASVVDLIGLQQDRGYMLVDAQGRYMTARHHPSLTQVTTRLSEHGMSLTAPGQQTLFLSNTQTPYQQTQVRIWGDTCLAAYVGKQYDRWFSDYLGTPCHLVKLPNAHTRPVDPRFGEANDQVSFADGFPLLLISEASLKDLNQRLTNPVTMSRFRPNVVVAGCAPYAEDHWQHIQLGDIPCRGVKNCTRCVVTTIDPDTGIKDPKGEPLKSLCHYRKSAGGVYFGQNLIPNQPGTLRLGETLQIL